MEKEPDNNGAKRSQRRHRFDDWRNPLTGLGDPLYDRRHGASLSPVRKFGATELETLYYSDKLAQLIANRIPHDMTRAWIELTVSDMPDAASAMLQALCALGAQTRLFEALVWARVFGSSLVVLGIDDGGRQDQETMAAPLIEEKIQALCWLRIYDRFDVEILSYYDDPFLSTMGEPEIYGIRTDPNNADLLVPVHASRIVRLDSTVPCNRRRKKHNSGFGESIFPSIDATLRDYAQSWGAVTNLLQEAGLLALKMQGFSEMLAADQDGVLADRLAVLEQCRSAFRLFPLDAEHEDLERYKLGIEGLAPILVQLALQISAISEIPVTLLFGQSPAGLQATGSENLRHYYDGIASKQETWLRPALERLVRLLFLAKRGPTAGLVPKSWSLTFRSLWQLSEPERAELRYKQAQTDAAYVNAGVLEPEEVATSRFAGGSYSTDTVLDTKRRDGDNIAIDYEQGGNG